MKRILLTASIVTPIVFAVGALGGGCGDLDDGGTGSTGTKTTSTAAGSGGSGGSGNPATTTGMAGDTTTTTGMAGNATTGQGGSGQGGSGQGGSGQGGSGQGGSGQGGAGGSGPGTPCGAQSSQACIDEVAGLKSDLGFQWKSSWMITGCQSKSAHDCITMPSCPGGADFEESGAVIKELFPLGGEMDKTYAVTFNFNGVSEGKYYTGGVRDAGDTQDLDTGVALDTFYRGGKAQAPSTYNVLRLRVLKSDKTEFPNGRYYLNSFPLNKGAESHRTFLLSYTKTIDVPGKGFIEYVVSDSNCHAIDNCNAGVVNGNTCSAARRIPKEENVALPAMYPDPKAPKMLVPIANLNSRTGATPPWHSQVAHLTITSVVQK